MRNQEKATLFQPERPKAFPLNAMAKCALQLPYGHVWLYAVSVHGACCVFGAVPIAFLFWTLLQKLKKKELDHDAFVVTALCTGILGAGVPLWMLYLIDDPPWMAMFLASTFGWSTFFKSCNVAFQQFPPGADASLASWMLWFVLIPEPLFNTKGKLELVTPQQMFITLRCFGDKFVGMFLLLSLLDMDYDYRLHLRNLPASSLILTAMNGYLHIWLLYLFLSLCTDFSTISGYATTRGGVAFGHGFDNPLLESRSFKEAWGLRWNLPVQKLLQRTAYVPLRRHGYAREIAAIATFCVSGLLHEYNFFIHNHYAYQAGKATLFFVVMGTIVLAEKWAWDHLVPAALQQKINRLPSVVIAVPLTLTAAIPFEWYFIQSWLDAGFVDCISKMFPHLSCN